MCCCFLAITSCQEYRYIGLWVAMLGIKQLLVRWQGCKGLSYNHWLYHGITGQKRQSGIVMNIWGGRFGMITSLPVIRNCSA